MTDADWTILEAYVRQIANTLGLRDWEITVSHEPCEQDNHNGKILAHVVPGYGRRCATVSFCEDFRAQSVVDQRMVVVHELIHCHLDPVSEVIRCDLQAMQRLARSEYEGLKSAHDRAAEFATDALAIAFAPFVPLIEWPAAEPAAESVATTHCQAKTTGRENLFRCDRIEGHNGAHVDPRTGDVWT